MCAPEEVAAAIDVGKVEAELGLLGQRAHLQHPGGRVNPLGQARHAWHRLFGRNTVNILDLALMKANRLQQ